MQKKQNWFKKYNTYLWNISTIIFVFGMISIITVIIQSTLVNQLPPLPLPCPYDSLCCTSYCFPFNWLGYGVVGITAAALIIIVYWAFKPNDPHQPTLKHRVFEKVS